MGNNLQTDVIYKAFGLSIKSEIPLDELPQIENNNIDIEVKIEELSKIWSEFSDSYNAFVVNENLVMFQVPDIATFAIKEGKTIIVSPLEMYDEDVVRLYLLGTCMGAILMQRNIYPLHGSCIEINGKAYAIVGESGAGKSTLASAFLNEGYKLLSDDVIAITLSTEENLPYVIPAYPQQKLWEESLRNFGLDLGDLRSIHGRETKYNVPVSQYHDKQLPLAGVFELIISKTNKIELRKIERLEQFYTLFTHTFRNCLIRNLGLMDWHFQTSAKILKNIKLFQLGRPDGVFSTPQLVSIMLTTINKGETRNGR
ncbi:aldolase [Mesobacillus foraminis]|uniref:aldolase n=1 Tax=Mesobacillus foraminis TaxID=279826 RepID=UPI001BE6186D|nr:aldolase [Mesobacillus foraminis]MBT2758429.1 aldolase [Mesobacillus foraminis]